MSDREPYRDAGACQKCEVKTLTWERVAARLSENAVRILSVALVVSITTFWGLLLLDHESRPWPEVDAHAGVSGVYSILAVVIAFAWTVGPVSDASKETRAGLVLAALHSLTLVMVSAIVCAVFQ